MGMYGDPIKLDKDVLYGIDKNNIVLQSLPLEYYLNYIPEKNILEYLKFTIVRIPYDRVVSDYSWKNRNCKNLYDFLILIKKYLNMYKKQDLIKYNKNISHNHFLPQYEYIKSDKFKMDHILKFENLQKDFNDKIDKNIILKKTNTSKHNNWETYFSKDPRCIQLVNEIYSIDFEKFKYKKLVFSNNSN